MDIAKTDTFEAALTISLQEICQAADWQYGEVWFPDGDLLRCHPAHYLASEQLAEFRKASVDYMFAPGAGLPGRVWILQEPEWIENVSLEPAIYYRSHLAKRVGLKAALGVPVLRRGEVLAVLVFYSEQAQPPDDRIIATFSDRIQSLMAQYGFLDIT